MLWALGQPIALIGLVAAFVAALVIRAAVQHLAVRRQHGLRSRPVLFHPRRDVDPFGVVGAVLGGTGWGRAAPPETRGQAGGVAIVSGPVAVLVASQLAFGAYRLAGGPVAPLQLYPASEILHGIPGPAVTQLLLSFATGLLCFGLLALVPLPPLDGWALLDRRAGPRPGEGFARAKHWLVDQNVGVVLLLVGLVIPLAGGQALLLFLLDLVTAPVLIAWAGAPGAA